MWEDFLGLRFSRTNNEGSNQTTLDSVFNFLSTTLLKSSQLYKEEKQKLSATSSATLISGEAIHLGVDPEINAATINAESNKKTLFGNLIARPDNYPKLSESDKILVTKAVIQDLKRLGTYHTREINSIIARISGAIDDSFIDEYEAIAISNYYTSLYAAKSSVIPIEPQNINNTSFQCRRVADPRNGGAGGRDTKGRRSQNTFDPPSVLLPHSRGSENRTSAQQERSQEMQDRMRQHIENERRKADRHPAGLRPITNIPKSPSNRGLGTGIGAMKDVLDGRGGITTLYAQTQGYNLRENTNEAIAQNIINTQKLTRKQTELTREALGRLDSVSKSINTRTDKELTNTLIALKKLEQKYTTDLAKLNAINATTKSSKSTRPSRSASLDKTGKLPRTSPGQPLSARSASLSNGTVRRQ
jgi:hypothetical protein